MANISNSYINAILADAAYVDLPLGVISEDALVEGEGLSKRLGLPLATYIAENFEVISAINTSDLLGSGFDAVVWKRARRNKIRRKSICVHAWH